MMPFANPELLAHRSHIPDIPTPFDETGAIDLKALAWLCERQIQAGVTAIVVGETSGRIFHPDIGQECATIIRTAASTARGRVRVIAAAGVKLDRSG